jgi:hypothetical protein
MKYYNEVRTHLSLEKDAPVSRTIERAHSLPPCPGRAASPVRSDLIYDRHSGHWWFLARGGSVANDRQARSGLGEAMGYACPDTLDIIALQHGER